MSDLVHPGQTVATEDPRFIRNVAKYQKGILYCILANFACAALLFVLPESLFFLVGLLYIVVWIASLVFMIALSASVYNVLFTILFVLLLFIPLLGLIALLIVNQKATSILNKAGVKVGLLGAKASTLPEIKPPTNHPDHAQLPL